MRFAPDLWYSPAAEQNKGPILKVLRRVLPAQGKVLEIASGSGQHVTHFASAFPDLSWQPSEPHPTLRDALAARVAANGHHNVLPPLDLDVFRQPWPAVEADALLCINMLHVAPETAVQALFSGAHGVLTEDAVLVLYGPFRRFGAHTAPSNAAFDADLRAQHEAWGVRDIEQLEAAAAGCFELVQVVDMPANNFALIFRRSSVAID
jgi:hypothetical protein